MPKVVLSLFQLIGAENGLTDEWVDFLDWLGAWTLHTEITEYQWPFVGDLVNAYERQPTRQSLLKILGCMALSGYDVSAVLPSTAALGGALDFEADTLFVRLSRGEWGAEEVNEIVAWACKVGGKVPNVVQLMLTLLDRRSLADQAVEPLLVALIERLENCHSPEWHLVLRPLLKLAQSVKSGLNTAEVWSYLQLPLLR
jgi:hypothetical protein